MTNRLSRVRRFARMQLFGTAFRLNRLGLSRPRLCYQQDRGLYSLLIV